jgi:hypothetical protein
MKPIEKLQYHKPTGKSISTTALGTALGLLAAWVAGFFTDIPGEIGVVFGTLGIFVVQRFPKIFGTLDA